MTPRLTLAALLLAVAPVAAQEPVFVTPPVTMYERGAVFGLEWERAAGMTAVAAELAHGVTPWLTLGLHAVGVDAAGSSPEWARLHLGTRVRLLKADRPQQWMILSAYAAGAVPTGDAAERVARAHGVADAVLGLSATRMARRGDLFADLSLARVPTPLGAVTSGALGLAAGWRPAPAAYRDIEAQLFAEAVGRYTEGGAYTVGLAPGVLVHSRRALLKAGVLLPTWTRRSARDATVKIAAKVLF